MIIIFKRRYAMPTVENLILLVVTFLITQGLKSLSNLAGKDFSGYASAIVAAVVALVVGLVQTVLLPSLPAEYLPIVETAAALLISILGAFGLHRTVKGAGRNG
jgi:di/tricarboxylate transporter